VRLAVRLLGTADEAWMYGSRRCVLESGRRIFGIQCYDTTARRVAAPTFSRPRLNDALHSFQRTLVLRLGLRARLYACKTMLSAYARRFKGWAKNEASMPSFTELHSLRYSTNYLEMPRNQAQIRPRGKMLVSMWSTQKGVGSPPK
jgi:hypothetical protein